MLRLEYYELNKNIYYNKIKESNNKLDKAEYKRILTHCNEMIEELSSNRKLNL